MQSGYGWIISFFQHASSLLIQEMSLKSARHTQDQTHNITTLYYQQKFCPTCDSTWGEKTNNHEDADTLSIHGTLDGKHAWVYASDVDVAVPVTDHRNLLSCRYFYFGVSAEKTDINSLHAVLGRERAKCLLALHFRSNNNEIRTRNRLVRKRTLNYLAKLTKRLSCVISTFLYGAFDCMLLSCNLGVSEWIYPL